MKKYCRLRVLFTIGLISFLFGCNTGYNTIEENVIVSEMSSFQRELEFEKQRNPDPGLTIYSHLKRGKDLINSWEALQRKQVEFTDKFPERKKMEELESEIEFNMLRKESQEWLFDSYLKSPLKNQLIETALLVNTDAVEVDDIESVSSIIELELILICRFNVSDYFDNGKNEYLMQKWEGIHRAVM